jgi:4'-phosphopantetheinyl transferase
MLVEVFQFPLEVDPEPLRAYLTPDELARADRFMFPEHTRRFIAARAQLRRLLTSRLKVESVTIETRERGKPYLPHHPELHFNLSHSHELAICALSGVELGIDLEWTPRTVEYVGVARRFFSPEEFAKLERAEDQRQAFFNGWTRKEAYIKAIGDGLSRPLDSFGVGILPGERPGLLWSRFPDEVERWSIYDLDLAAPYRGALAVEHSACEIRFAAG